MRRKVLSLETELGGGASIWARQCNFESLGLAVDWNLGNGSVSQLCANLGRDWLTTTRSQLEAGYYSSSPEAGSAFDSNRLPPWSAIWRLQASDQGSIPMVARTGPRQLDLRRQLQDLILDRVNHEVHLVMDVKLAHEIELVCIHGLHAQTKLVSNLFHRVAFSNHP